MIDENTKTSKNDALGLYIAYGVGVKKLLLPALTQKNRMQDKLMSAHFLTILDMTGEDAWKVLGRAEEMKKSNFRSDLFAGKTVAMIFEKASTRTRVSFEVAVRHLGGQTIFMTQADSQLGRSEPIRDTARVLSRYVDGLIVRTFEHAKLEELKKFGSIPVVNALSDDFHPCQVMSDILTIRERCADLTGVKVAWIGDGNNMAHSWINAAVHFPIDLTIAAPVDYLPRADIVENAVRLGAKITLTRDPAVAAAGARYINTDVWASMGQEAEQKQREQAFAGFQVNKELMALAAPDCKVMHCLPAHRGEEVTEDVLEGPASIIFDQAENRLHMQKAILEWMFTK